MSDPPVNSNSPETHTISQNKTDMRCDGGEQPDTDAKREAPGTTEVSIISAIEERNTSSSEYLTRSKAVRILTDQADIEDIDNEFDNIVSTFEKLLIDIAVLERSNVTRDINSNWDDLERISSSAISICEQSFDESLTPSSGSEYNLGTQFGRILATLTGRVAEDPRAARFHAGLSRAYTRYADEDEPYLTRSELVDDSEKFSYSDDVQLNRLEDMLDNPTKERIEKYDYKPVDGLIVRASLSSTDSTPMGLPDEIENYDSKELRDKIIDLLENECGRWFGMCTNIHLKIDEEWESIAEASVPCLDAKDTLRELWNMTNDDTVSDQTSNKIAGRYRRSSYTTQASHVLNSLSHQSKSDNSQTDKQLLHDQPIVKYDEHWELTPYGRLICLYIFRWEESSSLIHRCALNRVIQKEDDRIPQIHKETVRQGLIEFYDVEVTKDF